MSTVIVKNGISLEGIISAPPSKSEGVRAALLLALCGADPSSAFTLFPKPLCDDIALAITSCGEEIPYVGGSAALMRMLTPVRLALDGSVALIADARLAERGMGEYESCFGERFTKERLSGGGVLISMQKRLAAGKYSISCRRSSQFLSGLLLALPLLKGESSITVRNAAASSGYADMTFRMAKSFGANITSTESGYYIFGGAYSAPTHLKVSGDASYAANFIAANALGSNVLVTGVEADSRQPDSAMAELVTQADVDITGCPDLIAPIAAAACGRRGRTVIHGTGRLSHKESDRPMAVATLINSLGGEASVQINSITIDGRGFLAGGRCGAFGDHRIVMAAAVLAQICAQPVTIEGADAVTKSAPLFFDDLRSLGGVLI